MCGRFTLYASPDLLEERYNANFEEYTKYESYNIAPSQMTPVITNEDSKLIQMARFGIRPSWSKKDFINARAETIPEKPMWRRLFEDEKRCIVPSNGFYEWKSGTSNKKIPYFIKLTNQPVFSLAALWSDIKDKDGKISKQFSIITTGANNLMQTIHDRMPVIIPIELEQEWLTASVSRAAELLSPFNPKEMTAYPVSNMVNIPRNNSADMINHL